MLFLRILCIAKQKVYDWLGKSCILVGWLLLQTVRKIGCQSHLELCDILVLPQREAQWLLQARNVHCGQQAARHLCNLLNLQRSAAM